MPSIVVSLGIGAAVRAARASSGSWWTRRPSARASHLDAALRPADHVRGLQPLRQPLRGGGARPRRDRPGRRSATSSCRSSRRRWSAWRCSASPCPTTSSPARSQAMGAFNTLPLESAGDDDQRHHAGDLRAGHADHGLVAAGDRQPRSASSWSCAGARRAMAATPARPPPEASDRNCSVSPRLRE